MLFKVCKVAHAFYYLDNIPNEDYKLYVLAYGADGKFTSGKTLTVKVNAVGKASAPTVAKDGTVTWKAVKNAVKYRVIKIVNGVYYRSWHIHHSDFCNSKRQ